MKGNVVLVVDDDEMIRRLVRTVLEADDYSVSEARDGSEALALIDDVLDLFDIWLVKRDARSNYQHPTQKPPTLHERPLRRCSKPGDAVLDLTAGSGSTLVACEQLKRRAFLCEWEPRFCDLIVSRFEKLTGQKAELVGRAS